MSDDNPKTSATTAAKVDLTAEELVAKHGSKSAAIRALKEEGYTTSAIAKRVDVIYQHARNVLLRPLKRNNKEGNQNVKQNQEGD